MKKVSVVIPTLNAAAHFDQLLPALAAQRVPREMVLVVDSESDDDTCDKARAFGAEVLQIRRGDFDHGGTRRMATAHRAESEILVFLTQDAIPADPDSIHKLVEVFSDPSIGMAYGRQLPRSEARSIERHARLYNYPDRSEVRRFEDRSRLGVKTVFASDSFAAYAREALDSIGGFPEQAFFGEDQIVAGRMLMAGKSLAYVADACVTHSHGYSLREDFKRYFDVGIFHARNPWLLDTFGAVEGEGVRFLRSELAYLMRRGPLSIPSAFARTLAKYTAYKLGRGEAGLSNALKARLSMHAYHWRREEERGLAAV